MGLGCQEGLVPFLGPLFHGRDQVLQGPGWSPGVVMKDIPVGFLFHAHLLASSFPPGAKLPQPHLRHACHLHLQDWEPKYTCVLHELPRLRFSVTPAESRL